MSVRILALVLSLSLWPGTGETVEHVVHWMVDGDSVHGRGHRNAPPDDDGCPDGGHLCHLMMSCSCGGHLARALETTDAAPDPRHSRCETPAPRTPAAQADPAPLTRPPIA